MKLITEPSVYVIARQVVDDDELQRFLNDTGFPYWRRHGASAGQDVVEIAARTCYRSFNGGRPHEEHLRHLLEVGHGSCLEHAVWTLLFTGVSRSLTHEIVRHRHLSPSQESQRFVDASDVAFVVPWALMPYYRDWCEHGQGSLDPVSLRLAAPFSEWMDVRRAELNEYAEWTHRLKASAPAELLPTDRRKWARQAARSGLPNCAETRITMTGNARAWRGFIDKRATRQADVEIRRLAVAVHARLVVEAPALFGDYRKANLDDGTVELEPLYKVV